MGNLLKNIYAERWGELKTQTGFGTHLPMAIIGLTSKDESKVKESYFKIDNHVIVQSDLYEAAAYVPKYLEEVFIEAIHKEYTLDLLYEIGSGYSPDQNLMISCKKASIRTLKNLLKNQKVIDIKWAKKIQSTISDIEAS